MLTEKRALVRAIDFLKQRGWTVQDVCRLGDEHSGYDLLISKGSARLRVEVKGTEGPYRGIPDLYGTEVGPEGLLIADFLLVVFLPEGLPEKFAFIPREAFPVSAFSQKIGYRISPAYKNAKFIEPFLEAISETDGTRRDHVPGSG